MFNSETIPNLVRLLEEKSVRLYHSCQYQDFCSYLELGGIPSRKALESANLSMTPFTTDGNDRENDVWDKVFLNLQDFGTIFAKGRSGVPNVYGPILFRFKPRALLGATDVAICLRSAGAVGFNRDKESLKELDAVDRMFFYSPGNPNTTAALKSTEKLRETFGDKAQSVEISCTFPTGILSFNDLIDIVVDPYVLDDMELIQYVRSYMKGTGYNFSVVRRGLKISPKFYQIFLLDNKKIPCPTILTSNSTSPDLKHWAKEIEKRGGLLLRNYYQFLKYLQAGTYLPIKSLGPIAQISEQEDDLTEIGDDFFDEDFSEIEIVDLYSEEEDELVLEELNDEQDSWARSSDEGWFYSDEDDLDL